VQQVRIARIGLRDDIDLVSAAQINLPVDINVAARRIRSHRRAQCRHLQQLLGRRSQGRGTGAESFEQGAPGPRPRRESGTIAGYRAGITVLCRGVVGEFTGVSSHKTKEIQVW